MNKGNACKTREPSICLKRRTPIAAPAATIGGALGGIVGGTADAIRHELSTGSSIRGQHHIQKGQDWIRALRKIQEKETLSENEQIIVKELIEDSEKALRGE